MEAEKPNICGEKPLWMRILEAELQAEDETVRNRAGAVLDGIGEIETERDRAIELLEAATAELTRVAPFLAIHNFGGYSMGETIPIDAYELRLSNNTKPRQR